MYQVLARKWRPQRFDDLVGQESVARTLTNALVADRLAHAYVFAGLRGTGKTTVARILAKCLNCEKGPTASPCGVCAPCVEIAESRALDVLEIDAASRTKVEQTRELLDLVSYAPVRDRYKVLIIDEAHMLSKASFNALLKTLEEPPPNVLFLLATTELQKVLPTVLSRCQVFEFRRVTAPEVARHLQRICEDEKIEISGTSLDRLARAGEGSVRDSLSLLERVLAFSGPSVADEDVLRMLGAVRAEVLERLFAALARRDPGAMLAVLDSLIDEGHDLVHFWSELVGGVRDLLLLETLPDRHDLLVRSPEEGRALAGAAAGLSREDLTRVFQVLAELEPGLKASAQPRFLFEAALFRLADLGSVRPIEEVLERLAGTAPVRTAPTAGPPPAPPEKKKHAEPPPADPTAPALVAAVAASRPLLGAMLEQAAALVFHDRGLVVRLPPEMEAVKRQLEQRESLALLQREVERLSGKAGTVRIELAVASDVPDAALAPGPGARTAEPRPAEPPAAEPRASEPRAAQPRAPGSQGLIEEARGDAGVRSLLDTFGAQIVDIRHFELPGERGDDGTARTPAEDAP